jgi:predicted AAA+ superfamily ATPase
MKEMNLDHGTVVTTSEEETIDVESGTISVVPVWRFLIS